MFPRNCGMREENWDKYGKEAIPGPLLSQFDEHRKVSPAWHPGTSFRALSTETSHLEARDLQCNHINSHQSLDERCSPGHVSSQASPCGVGPAGSRGQRTPAESLRDWQLQVSLVWTKMLNTDRAPAMCQRYRQNWLLY